MQPGTVTKVWLFVCAVCDEQLGLYSPSGMMTKASAEKKARSQYQWSLEHDRGWVCKTHRKRNI